MEFQFQDVKQGFTSPDFLFNFEAGGNLAPKYNAPPAPNSIENLTAEYILKQQQLADAVRNQHRIDNIYERVMNEAPRRDVEVLPPETPGSAFDPNRTRMKNITPVDQAQEISELLEKQVKRPATTPTTAEPPTVPSYKSIPLTDPLATPPSYTPRRPVSGPNPSPTAKPSGLPATAGKYAVPLAGGVVDFAFRTMAGQPPAKAAFGAAGSTAGSVVGSALGAGFGPAGMFVGGVIGGAIGGAIADLIYDAASPPPASAKNPEPVPYDGGWSDGIAYRIDFVAIYQNGGRYNTYAIGWGAFQGSRVIYPKTAGTDSAAQFFWRGQGNKASSEPYWDTVLVQSAGLVSISSILITSITPLNVSSDPPPNNYVPPPPPPDPRPYYFQHPGESEFAPRRGIPAAAPPPPTGYAPGTGTPKGTPRGDAPNTVPPGFPAPKKDPNPNTTPSNLGGNFPGSSPSPAPSPNPQPQPQPFSFKLVGPPAAPSPGGSGGTTELAPPGIIPSGLPKSGSSIIPPDGNKNIPPSTPPGTGNPTDPPTPTSTPSSTTSDSNICNTSCMRNLTQKINNSEISWLPLPVPVVSCTLVENKWTPTTEIQLITILATPNGNDSVGTYTKFQELAKANTELCLAKNKEENPQSQAVLTLPERYQIPVDGHIPQIIYVFREVRDDGTWGERMYPMCVPHPKSTNPPNQRPLPDYKKGSWELILTLKDNTKVFINAFSIDEAQNQINKITPLIADQFLENSFQKIGQRKGQQLLEIKVRIFKVDYFEKGTKNVKPTWSKYFR
ncbi:hypothetical protein NIES4103_21850 [Nostoc sp. NIES-4103]|nr:hypothetical protein NIES4103_21850 [Nostoc sp. NIES-4103]